MAAGAILGALGTLGQIAGSYYQNALNMKNQLAINKANIGMQLAYNADQVAVAQMNNQTQIDMANTAHQREVKDLRDAGLNPILSATGGNGAAMPSLGNPNGAAASVSAYQPSNPLKELGTSAREVGRILMGQMTAESELAKEEVRQMKLNNDLLAQDVSKGEYQSRVDKVRSKNELLALEKLTDPVLHVGNASGADVFRDIDLNDRLSEDVLEDIKLGILSDIANRRWSNVRNWVDTASTATDAAVNAGTSLISAGAKAGKANKAGQVATGARKANSAKKVKTVGDMLKKQGIKKSKKKLSTVISM